MYTTYLIEKLYTFYRLLFAIIYGLILLWSKQIYYLDSSCIICIIKEHNNSTLLERRISVSLVNLDTLFLTISVLNNTFNDDQFIS